MQKRGLSAIVTTLLVIVLVLVATGIVWGVVRNIVKNSSGNVGTGTRCLNIDVSPVAINCGNPAACVVNLQRTGSDDGEIGGVKLVFYEGTSNSGVIDVSGDIASLVGKTTTENSNLDAPDKLEVTVYLEDESGNEQLCSQKISSNINQGVGGTGGSEPGGEEPEEGECVSECGNRVCGPDPDTDCTEPCGVCISGECSPDGLECIGCTPYASCELAGAECGTPDNGCGGFLDCPECPGGEICVEGLCIETTSIADGNVDEVWPSTGMYFASMDLLDWEDEGYEDYSGRYLSYTGAAACKQITNYITTDLSGYDKVIIAFSSYTIPVIAVGNHYYIWNSYEECDSNL